MKKKLLIALIAILLLVPGILVYAADDTNLITSNVTEVEAGSVYTFSVDLTTIPETYTNYTLSLTFSPAISYITTDQDVSVTYNAVTKAYEFASTDLASLTSLTVSAYLPADAVAATTYTVTAVALNTDTADYITDDLTFTSTAAQTETNDDTGESTTGDNTATAMSGSSASTGTAAASTGTASASTTTTTDTTTTYQGSYNNYLESLSVTDYDFQSDFQKTYDTYFVTVPNDVTDVTVNAEADDSDATVAVTGNSDLEVGINKVLISVTAENGNVRTYRIYVTREDQ